MSVTHTTILFRLLLLLGLALSFDSMSAQPVDNERSQANPTTQYKWFHNKSANEVNAIAGNTYRLIDLVIVDKSPFRFSGVMVRNSGVHQKPWGWFVGLTVSQMDDSCSKYNMRPLDVEVYRDGNQKRVAFVMVDNTGDQGIAWHFYSDRTLDFLIDKCDEKAMRLTDLDTYTVNGQRNYSGLMIRNTGDNYKAWWVYNNRTGAQLLADANQHNANIVDLERKGDNNYVAVMERSSDSDFREQGVLWRGERLDNITEVARHFGARIIDIEPYMKNGQRYFDLLMLDNVNPLTTRVGNILRNNTDGNIAPYSDDRTQRGYTVGFRLEEVNGSTLAALQSDRKFYPASTIKIQEYWYIYRTLLQNDPDPANTLLNTNWNMCRQGTVNCTNNSNTSVGCDSSVSMRNLLRTMMFNSNNRSTNAIQDYAGNGNASTGRNLMNAWASFSLGISGDTRLKHKLACNNVSNAEPNIATVRDFNKMYERIFSDPAALNPALEGLFIQNMLNKNNGMFTTQITDVINEEAAKLGLSNADVAAFIAGARFVHKNGNIGTGYTSAAGWIELPYYCGLGSKQFAFSMFWDRASTIDKQNTGNNLNIRDVCGELLRDEIRKALASCKSNDLAVNAGTGEPIPGVSVELQKLVPGGRFIKVDPRTTRISPAQNPITSSRAGTFSWQILEPGTYRYKLDAPGFQTTFSTTTIYDDSFKIKKPDTTAMAPVCPGGLTVFTCPDQYVAPHYEGRQIARISATARGGQVPYSFTWSNGASGEETFTDPVDDKCGPWCDSFPPENNPIDPGPVRYTVTVTDAQGCQATAVHTVNIVDISCALPNGKPAVEMCRPQGRGTRTVCVDVDMVPRRLSMGWSLGNCRDGYDFTGGSCGNPQATPTGTGNGNNRRDAVLEESATVDMTVFPNPFSQHAKVMFGLPEAANVSLELYTLTGQRMAVVLNNEHREAGSHELSLPTQQLAEGMYVLVLKSDSGISKQMKLVKRN